MIRFVEVTQDDIKNGLQCDSDKCAIAIALKREYKTNDVEVSILHDYASLCVGKDELNIRHENKVLDFIYCYDNMDDMDMPSPKPFTLEVVEKVGS